MINSENKHLINTKHTLHTQYYYYPPAFKFPRYIYLYDSFNLQHNKTETKKNKPAIRY